MPQLKIAAVLAVAILLQLSLRAIWSPLSYIDFPLIVVVYIALQRHAWQALIVGTVAGLAVDAASGGLIGAGGFSKTLTAYIIYVAATRINLENALLRIPVLAAATLFDSAIYVEDKFEDEGFQKLNSSNSPGLLKFINYLSSTKPSLPQ